MATPRRTIRIDDELWELAQQVATTRGETVSDVLRRFLELYTGGVPPSPFAGGCEGASTTTRTGT